MRVSILGLLFASLAFGGDVWLVLYDTQEKCYECGYRYAMVCSWVDSSGNTQHGDGDCNVPWKSVPRVGEFKTRAEALAFINGPENVRKEIGSTSGMLITAIAVSNPEPHLPHNVVPESVRLIRGETFSVKVTRETKTEPQPPKQTEVVKYEVSK